MKNTIIILMMLACVIAFAQSDISSFIGSPSDALPIGMDVRAFSMGNCIAANSQGAASMLRNPSGIGWIEKGQFSFTGALDIMGSHGFEEDVYEDLGYEEYSSKSQIFPKISGIGFATPIPVNAPFKLVGGLGWGKFFDFSGKSKTTWEAKASDQEYEATSVVSGGFHILNPTIAACFADNYVVGVSYGFAMMSNNSGKIEGEYKNPDSDSESEFKSDLSGSIMQLSGQAKFMDRIKVGFSFAPAFEIEYKDPEVENDPGGEIEYDDIEYEFPAYMAIGAAYDFTEDITVTAEYQNRPYDDTEVENTDIGVENGSSFRVGFEYRGPIALRAGFFTDKLAVEAEPGEDEPASGMGITGGIGVAVGPIGLDIGAFYQSAKWEQTANGKDEEYKSDLIGVAATAVYEIDLF